MSSVFGKIVTARNVIFVETKNIRSSSSSFLRIYVHLMKEKSLDFSQISVRPHFLRRLLCSLLNILFWFRTSLYPFCICLMHFIISRIILNSLKLNEPPCPIHCGVFTATVCFLSLNVCLNCFSIHLFSFHFIVYFVLEYLSCILTWLGRTLRLYG